MRGLALPVVGLLGALLLADIAFVPEAGAKSAAWLRRDREIIRQLNRRELAYVRQRDARYAAQNRASLAAQDDYARRRAGYERDMDDYHAQRRRYRQRLADWREDVRRCRSGDWSACD